jgi:hypothetical protein
MHNFFVFGECPNLAQMSTNFHFFYFSYFLYIFLFCMASNPINLSSSARRASFQSLGQNNIVGPFSAPETAAQQFSPPTRQLSFGSNSQSLVSNCLDL